MHTGPSKVSRYEAKRRRMREVATLQAQHAADQSTIAQQAAIIAKMEKALGPFAVIAGLGIGPNNVAPQNVILWAQTSTHKAPIQITLADCIAARAAIAKE